MVTTKGDTLLKLRRVEIVGFKSFCERTVVTFSGNGTTCIVGPNGCGKSNVVDAISWVLGEQSHKSLRAERMADCIFNGTAKRPPMGLAEVTLTLIDPELSEAVAKVIDAAEEEPVSGAEAASDLESPVSAAPVSTPNEEGFLEMPAEGAPGRKGKRRSHKSVLALRPGEVVVGRRLYRSGQSE